MLRRPLFLVVLGALMTAWVPAASAKDVCMVFQTSGLFLTFKKFVPKRGTAIPVSGYFTEVAFPNELQTPVSGEAIAATDGKRVAIGLTEYPVDINAAIGPGGGIGGGAGTTATTYALLFQNGMATGATGNVMYATHGGNPTTVVEDAKIKDCGKKDGSLAVQ